MAMKLRKKRQIQSIREEGFWSKNKVYGGLCASYYLDHPNKIIHAATNDLTSKKESTEISSNIVDLALKLKPDTFQVSLSNLTARNDQKRKKAPKF